MRIRENAFPVDTGRKLKYISYVHSVLCTFNLRPVSTRFTVSEFSETVYFFNGS